MIKLMYKHLYQMYEIAATFFGDKVVPVEKTQTMF